MSWYRAAVVLVWGVCMVAHAADEDARIEQALEAKLTVRFVETPLGEVLRSLRERLGIKIELDENLPGVAAETPMTFSVSEITGKGVLSRLVAPLELAWVVKDGAVLITSPEKASTFLTTEDYDLADVIETNDPRKRRVLQRELTIAITTTIRPKTWKQAGGLGETRFEDAKLVIAQTAEVHQAIRRLIDVVRELKQLPGDDPAPAPMLIDPLPFAATAAVQKALQRKVTLDFDETSFVEVLEQIEKLTKINIRIDHGILEDSGVGTDPAVTIHVKEVSVAEALTKILQPLDLGYLVIEDVVLVTTLERVRSEFSTVLYPLRDLITAQIERDGNADELMSIMVESLGRQLSKQNVGRGSAALMRIAPAIVVRGTSAMHEEVAGTLRKVGQDDARRLKP